MQILIIILLKVFIVKCYPSNSSCLPCISTTPGTCYNCTNTFPADYTYIEKLSILCNSTNHVLQEQDRFYSIIKSYSIRNCTIRTFYFDQYTLWNYLESLSITYAHLTRLSPVIYNRSLSYSSILYGIKTLNLSHNSIRIISTNFSYYFPSLEKLDLSHNHLILIQRRTFINLIHLKELYLNHNYLKQISSTIFPRQSLRLVNLKNNRWYCSCANALVLSISQPIPNCQTPSHYKNQNAGDIARQCFFRSKAIILITINIDSEPFLTCALSSTIDVWKHKINETIHLRSAWHIEQRRPIAIEYLYALSKRSDKYLICFNLNSTQSETIHMIIPLTLKSNSFNSTNSNETLSMNATTVNRTIIILKPERKLPKFFLWLFNASKSILPKFVRASDQYVLIVWIILLTIVLLILSLLIYFIRRQRKKTIDLQLNSFSDQLIELDDESHGRGTILNLKFSCKDHKCLCQYRRRAHSTMYLAESLSSSESLVISNLEAGATNTGQPLLIKPIELRYAKIKRISSIRDLNHDYLTGQFRTTVKLKSLPY